MKVVLKDYDEAIKQVMRLHYGRLGERDRRQYAAVEAMKLGYGGVTYVSKLFCVDRKTIGEGKKELLSEHPAEEPSSSRQRRPGGGRKKKGSPG